MTTVRHFLRFKTTLLATAGVLVFACNFTPRPAHAAGQNTSTRAQAQSVKDKLAAQQAEKTAIEKQSKILGTQVNDLNKKLVSTTAAVRKVEENLNGSEDKLKTLTARRDQLAESLQRDEKGLGSLVSAARKYNSLSTPLLLMRERPIDAARSAFILKSLMPALQNQSDDMKAQLVELAATEDRIREERGEHAKELSEYNDKQDKLQQLLKTRTNSYHQTEAERKKQEVAVAALARQAKSLDDLIEKMNQAEARRAEQERRASKSSTPAQDKKTASTYKLPARFLPPVSGGIRTGFDEKDALGARSKGVTFAARAGASVVTPLAGKVLFAGPFQKYKQILIVEHDGGYHSLIAGLGHIDTVVGANLAAGEPVGAAERSSENALIYYELRHNGKPVNPQSMNLAQR